jgi:hypothetical protein
MRWWIDGHLDLAWNALSWGRDIMLDLDRLNRDEIDDIFHGNWLRFFRKNLPS